MTTPVSGPQWDLVERFRGMGMEIKLELHRASKKGMLQIGHCFFPVSAIGLEKMNSGSSYGSAEVRLDGIASGGRIATWYPHSKTIEINFDEATRAFEVDKRFSPNVPFAGIGAPAMRGTGRFSGE